MDCQDHYIEKYGVAPIFTASINSGKVTVAEVGTVKAELAFHGDVLNAAARVQGLCKVYKENLLITENIKLTTFDFTTELIDNVDVTGRNESIGVYSVKKFVVSNLELE